MTQILQDRKDVPIRKSNRELFAKPNAKLESVIVGLLFWLQKSLSVGNYTFVPYINTCLVIIFLFLVPPPQGWLVVG